MKKTLLASLLAFVFCLASAVTWQVSLTDSYGDGWTGNALTVFVNGNPVLTNITLDDGTGPLYFDFEVNNGDGVTADFFASGDYYDECAYYVWDHDGNQVAYRIGETPFPPGNITEPIIVVVGSVLSPDDFLATPVSESQINLSWTLNDNSDPVLLAWSADGDFGVPAADAVYDPGDYLDGGGQVLYRGSATAFAGHAGLAPGTTYYYRIWSFAASKAVVYSSGISAQAATFTAPVSGFPYLTDFDNAAGWTTSQDYSWDLISEGNYPVYPTPHSPLNMACYNSMYYPLTATGYLTSPPLNLPTDDNAVSFWMHRDYNGSWADDYDLLNVYYSTSGDLSKASTLLGAFYRYAGYAPVEDTEGWYQYTLPLPAGSQGNYRFVIFEGVSDYGQDIYIDDVLITSENPLPVELSSFTATQTVGNQVTLNWVTQSETNLQGYYILRNAVPESPGATLVSPLIEGANSSEQHSYSFTDTEIFAPGSYYYWLQNVDFGGEEQLHGPVSVNVEAAGEDITPEIPAVTGLQHVYPNPFSLSASVPFSLKERARVQISVYNSRGQLLRHFDLAEQAAGAYQIAWDGRDANGHECGSGVYSFVMRTGARTFQRKAVLIK